jgi:hypothetical protein
VETQNSVVFQPCLNVGFIFRSLIKMPKWLQGQISTLAEKERIGS